MSNQLRLYRTRLRNHAGRASVLTAPCVAMAVASPAQVFTVIKRFNGTKGADPASPPVEGYDLNLYGTTVALGANSSGTFYRLKPGGVLGVLHNFYGIAGCSCRRQRRSNSGAYRCTHRQTVVWSAAQPRFARS